MTPARDTQHKASERTPGPWVAMEMPGPQSDIICEAETGERVCELPYGLTDPKDGANAAFIVRACNGHAALVEALEAGLALVMNPDAEASDADAFERMARHALKAAQGDAP